MSASETATRDTNQLSNPADTIQERTFRFDGLNECAKLVQYAIASSASAVSVSFSGLNVTTSFPASGPESVPLNRKNRSLVCIAPLQGFALRRTGSGVAQRYVKTRFSPRERSLSTMNQSLERAQCCDGVYVVVMTHWQVKMVSPHAVAARAQVLLNASSGYNSTIRCALASLSVRYRLRMFAIKPATGARFGVSQQAGRL